jgi:hypothetical protein
MSEKYGASVSGAIKAFTAITEHLKDKPNVHSGVVECPKCGVADALQFTRARSNGHIWGKCKTPGCVSFMQ